MKIRWKAGLWWCLAGAFIILVSLTIESLTLAESAAGAGAGEHRLGTNIFRITLKAVDDVGIAILALGLIHIMIETKDWSDYFSKRLREIVIEQSYLSTLDKAQLTTLQTGALKAEFKDPNIDREGGFLNYLRSNLHRYIAAPYREDVAVEVRLTDHGDSWDVDASTSYVCRKGTSGIQPDVTWHVDEGEYESIDHFEVTVHLPFTHADRGKKEKISDNKLELGKRQTFSLVKFEQIDRLIVVVTEKYKVKKDRFQYWTMAHPTRNFSVTITYPNNYDIQVKPIVLNPDLVLTTRGTGFYKAKYDFWVLPESGIFWTILPKIKSV